jgi:L-iditol 2-dehydrogenase
MSDDEGALIEPLSVALWACRKARLRGGDRVLVTGAGPIGLLVMKVAFALGVADATVTDVHPQRLEIARQLGATRTLNVGEQTINSSDSQVDVLFECSGTQSALMDGIRALRPAGTAVVVGMHPGETLNVPMSFIQNREITLTGTFRFANTYADAIALVAGGRVDVRSVVTGRYGLHEAEQALQATKLDPTNIKSIVAPS